MSSLSRLSGFLGLALLALPPLAAQKVPDLTGTWVMALDKSDFGPLPARPWARKKLPSRSKT